MMDIVMCPGDGCPIKDTCFRHVGVPREDWDAWFSSAPYDGEGCDMYWPINTNKKQQKDVLKTVEIKRLK